ncbi:MAG: phospholipid carrier-dependent glycosyltransferase [Actinomycetota bacterium]
MHAPSPRDAEDTRAPGDPGADPEGVPSAATSQPPPVREPAHPFEPSEEWMREEDPFRRPEQPRPDPAWQRLTRFLRKPVFVLIAIGIIAAVPRFYHLSQPHDRVFDEVYYTKDGCLYAGYPYKQCGLTSPDEQSWVHPPLGKWMIAAGIGLFGNHPFGWRVSAAFIGTLTCVLVAWLALVLWQSSLWAFVAGLLAATESLLVVQSRTALLDIFEAFWVVAGFLFLALDKGWIERRTSVADPGSAPSLPPGTPPRPDATEPAGVPAATTAFSPPPEPGARPAGTWTGAMHAESPAGAALEDPGLRRPRAPSPFWRPWRVASGLAFGCAVAVKWSALAALASAILLSVIWERTRRYRAGLRRPFRLAVTREALPVLVSLLLFPTIMYLLSYSGRIEKSPYPPYRYRPGLGYSWVAHPSRLVNLTWQIQNFHHGLKAEIYDTKTKKYTPAHPYQSRPWSWIALGRPIAYFYKADHANKPNERRREVLGIGNPAIFWFMFLAIPWLGVMWRRRRDWRAGLILVALVSQYLFWLIPYYSLPKVQFFFYATPIAPFFVLAATYVARDLARMRLAGSSSRPFLPVSIAYVITAVGMFVWFWPVLSGEPLTVAQWTARMWFRSWI